MTRLTVFTPTYNRANTIGRVFNCLCRQTYRDFEWMIIDDGSVDNTREIVEEFKKDAWFDIKYFYQENAGKHVATNRAVNKSNSELFLIADSDDGFTDNALERLVEVWDSIPENEKKDYKGVICRCYDHDTGKPYGPEFPKEQFDSNDIEAYFKLKLRSEKWNLTRTDVFKEFPFPEIKNAHFFPETVTWQCMAKKYKTRYINDCLREYYRDAENSVTVGKKSVRYRENIYLWSHFINNTFQYFWYYPKRFIQSFIGLSRDGILNGYSLKKIISIPNTIYKKFLCILFYPVGVVLSKKYR